MNSREEFTLAFHFPTNYVLPNKGSVEIRLQDLSDRDAPTTLFAWGSNQLPVQPWCMQFGVEAQTPPPFGFSHSVSVSIRQGDGSLLVNEEKLFRHTPGQAQDINLSPSGHQYVEYLLRTRIARPADATWTAVLHESDDREAILGQATTRFSDDGLYIDYDPALVIPGKKYSLSGTENSSWSPKGLRVRLHPRDIVLKAITPDIQFGTH
jgi:uncharacterized lipoprotein YbaY